MDITVHKCKNISHPFPVIAWLIMLFQGIMPWKKDSWSHMALGIDDGNTLRYLDCSFKGVKIRNEKEFLNTYKLIDSHSLDIQETEVGFFSWYKTQENKKYDFLQLPGLMLKLIGITKTNKIGHNKKRLICNELCLIYVAQKKDIELGDSDNYDMVETWNLLKRY